MVRTVRWLVTAVVVAGSLVPGVREAAASHGGPHAAIRYWNVGADPQIRGYDPHETFEDSDGVTGHVATAAAPLTMVTSMENTRGGYCGPLYWNPETNVFKTYPVTGGFQAAGDVNREAPALTQGSRTFGPGDAWFTVNGNTGYSVYVNFKNSDAFRRYTVTSSALGVKVDQASGKILVAAFFDGQIIELDPAANALKRWAIGNRPYWLDVDADGNVYTAAATNGSLPDQIVRLNRTTNTVTRWNIPGGGLQAYTSFGMPNSVRVDPEGNLWFSQPTANKVGKLNPATNQILQYSGGGIDDPNGVAASGAGSTLQSFFTERSGDRLSLITAAQAAPTTTSVTPSTVTVAPASSTASFADLTIRPVTSTITPVSFDSAGTAVAGITRFPIPPGVASPAGVSRVVKQKTIFGSFEGTDHVFKLESDAIIAAPPSKLAAEGYGARVRADAVPVDTGKTGRAFVDKAGVSSDSGVLDQEVPGVAALGVSRSRASGEAQGDLRTARGASSIADVSLLGGTVTAEAVSARASASFDTRTTAGSTSSEGSGFVNLRVNGTPVSDSIPPNTKIPIPGVGTVTLREERSAVVPVGAALQVNMIHAVSEDGSVEIVLGSAFAGAGRAVASPGDAAPKLPIVPAVPPVPFFAESFERGRGGWTAQGQQDLWEFGPPTYGPSAAADGVSVAGTKIAGPYPGSSNGMLVSPAIDLSWFDPSAENGPFAGKKALLHLRSWWQTYSYYDCGFIQASTDGGVTWTTITPKDGYPYASFSYCGGYYPPASFAGTSDGWTPVTLDLTPYAGRSVMLGFRFASYYGGAPAGWYLDDFRGTIE